MSKSFSTRLYEAFEKHGELQMPADRFLFILRRVDPSISADVGAALIRNFGDDSGYHVDIKQFCAWFEDIEPEPGCTQPSAISLTSGSSEGATKRQAPLQSDSGIEDPSGGVHAVHDEVKAEDGGHASTDQGEELVHRTLSFNLRVEADDDSFWALGSEDKYTLPSYRRLSEREKLMADFRASLNQVKARLEASPVTFRNHLRG
eukprot:TRINITY_DN12748_c0_g1_i3.p1 TRINITY_DN12748_c0_g1~~TRINITY_DN12748_c0_g1_i3.p1  ORF type:complete len:204 (+),score=26.87 TRINITY_DN12748_c0_g1_i3:64-675(+)